MKIHLFIACYNDTLFPETGQAVVRILERLGHQVIFPEAQTCCGQMHFNTGYRAEAYPLARRMMAQFRDAEVVCIPSSSCVALIRESYRELAEENNDHAMLAELTHFIPRCLEFSELLVDHLRITDLGASFPHRVTYHASCHGLRTLCLGSRPTTLLQAVRGLELLPLAGLEQCCGFGGTFAVKNAEVSGAMLAEKARAIANTGAEIVTAVDNSCLMHLNGYLHRQYSGIRTMHLAEILASEGGPDARHA
jgi:L-lactate dehydrogenase complex protein LldE